jgi:hypothetical protein
MLDILPIRAAAVFPGLFFCRATEAPRRSATDPLRFFDCLLRCRRPPRRSGCQGRRNAATGGSSPLTRKSEGKVHCVLREAINPKRDAAPQPAQGPEAAEAQAMGEPVRRRAGGKRRLDLPYSETARTRWKRSGLQACMTTGSGETLGESAWLSRALQEPRPCGRRYALPLPRRVQTRCAGRCRPGPSRRR